MQSLKKKASDDNCNLMDRDHCKDSNSSHHPIDNRDKVYVNDSPSGSLHGNNLTNSHSHHSKPSSSFLSLSGGSDHSLPTSSGGNHERRSDDRVLGASTGSTISIQQASNRIRAGGISSAGIDYHHHGRSSSEAARGADSKESHDSHHQDQTIIDHELLSSHSRIHGHSHVRCRSRDQLNNSSVERDPDSHQLEERDGRHPSENYANPKVDD